MDAILNVDRDERRVLTGRLQTMATALEVLELMAGGYTPHERMLPIIVAGRVACADFIETYNRAVVNEPSGMEVGGE